MLHSEGKVTIISPLDILSAEQADSTANYLNGAFSAPQTAATESACKWSKSTEAERDQGIMLTLDVAGAPKQVTWHKRGDYFATVSPDGAFHPSFAVFSAQTHRSLLSWKSSGVDTSDYTASYSGALQEDQRSSSEGRFPSCQTSFLCRCEYYLL